MQQHHCMNRLQRYREHWLIEILFIFSSVNWINTTVLWNWVTGNWICEWWPCQLMSQWSVCKQRQFAKGMKMFYLMSFKSAGHKACSCLQMLFIPNLWQGLRVGAQYFFWSGEFNYISVTAFGLLQMYSGCTKTSTFQVRDHIMSDWVTYFETANGSKQSKLFYTCIVFRSVCTDDRLAPHLLVGVN